MKLAAVLFFYSCISLATVAQPGRMKKYNLPGFVQINDSLYISKYEVSISDYAKFLLYLDRIEKDSVKLTNALPQPNSTDWTMWSSYSKELITYNGELFTISDTSVSFISWLSNFPVVNINKTQANEFCIFKGLDYDVFYQKLKPKQKNNYPAGIVFRLPSAREWTKIAGIPLENPTVICREYFYKDKTGERMPVRISKGCFNFSGVYNMTGNVAELVGDNDKVYGGSFKESIENCNSTSSRAFSPGDNATGFRIVAIVK